jgi:predicted DNA-binding transcriptional regulator AlpA
VSSKKLKTKTAPALDRLISREELCAILGGVSFVNVWRWIGKGKFPPGRSLGTGGRTMWLESEVREWMARLPERHYKSENKKVA